MARTAWSFTIVSLALEGMAAMAILGTSRAAAAAESPSVTVHIDNCARVSDQHLQTVRAEVARIYRAAGVQIAWSTGALPVALTSGEAADKSRHLALILTDDDEMPGRTNVAPDSVIGLAARDLGRAYVFVDRVAEASARLAVDRFCVLAWAIAHELGHLLLPPNSHSREGIMRATLAFDLGGAGSHAFTAGQPATIRAALAR